MNKRKISKIIILSTLSLALTFSPVLKVSADQIGIGTSNNSSTPISQTTQQANSYSSTFSDYKEKQTMGLVVVDSSGTQFFNDVRGKSIAEILSEHGLNYQDYRISDGTQLDKSTIIPDNKIVTVFKSELDGTSESVTLQAPEQDIPTDSLYVGQTKVQTDGSDGKAIKTTITTHNLAQDKTVNNTTTDNSSSTTSEETITVIDAPVTKIVLVGTKALPKVTQTVVNNINSTSLSNRAVSAASVAGIDTSNKIINLALAQLGKSYVWGSSGPNSFDCSGLIYWLYDTNNGYNIPRTAYEQGLYSTPVNPSDIQPGDVVWTKTHIGLYVGNGVVVHAANPSEGVIVSQLSYFLANGYNVGRFTK